MGIWTDGGVSVDNEEPGSLIQLERSGGGSRLLVSWRGGRGCVRRGTESDDRNRCNSDRGDTEEVTEVGEG